MTENVGYASMQVIPSFRGFEAAARRELSGSLGTVGRETGERLGLDTSEGFGTRISGMSKYAKAAALGVGVALNAGAVGVAKWGLGIASANEQAQISFETMLGSATKATSFLDDLKEFAASTPFEFPELQTAASSLISAGIEAGKVIPIMTSLGDVTAGMGTGSEGIKRATVALQQMQAAGKITGEDLNQLRDAGVPVYDLLAAATGKAKTEVAALAQAGKLGKTELDQLMGALESGAGLERFSGLMDKQSESLAGLGSTLKDNLGQGLATAMEPTVELLKDALPAVTDLANEGLALLGPAIASALESGQDFAAWIAPIADDIGSHLMPVLEDLWEIARNALPDALHLAAGGIVAVQHAVNPLLDGVGKLTGFLADHEEIVLAVAGAYAAWKIADIGTNLGSTAVDGVRRATASLADMRTAIQNIAATRGISEASATLGVLRSTLTSPVSGGAAAGGALAGLAVGATIAIKSLERSAENGREQAEKFIKALDVDPAKASSMQSALADLQTEMATLSEEADRSNWAQVGQRLNPFDENTIDEAKSKQEELGKVFADYAKDLSKVYGAAKLLGTNGDEVTAWAEKLDINLDDVGPKRLAWAIGEARNAALNGTPATDDLAEAYKTLASETSTSKEKIDAWKTSLDIALDRPQSLFDATTAYAEGLASFQETLTGGSWGQFGTDTEAGRANREALSGMVDNVQNLAGAYADMGQTDKAAEAIRVGREEIVKAGTAAGLSEEQITDYMESLGLTEGTWKAQVELDGAKAAKEQMDTLNGLLENFDGKRAQAYIDLALNAPWIKDTAWWDALVNEGVTPWFLGDGGRAPANSRTEQPAPDRSPANSRAGRPQSSRGPVTIISQGSTTRAISDDLLWHERQAS